MNTESYKTTLKFFTDYFANKDIKWCLGGSGALLVHGVKVSPKDIDIIVNPEDFDTVYNDLKDTSNEIENFEYLGNTLKKFYTKGAPALGRKVNIEEIPTEIVAFDLSSDELVQVEWNGLKIPIHTLEQELIYYLKRPGKEEEVKLIRKRIEEIKRLR